MIDPFIDPFNRVQVQARLAAALAAAGPPSGGGFADGMDFPAAAFDFLVRFQGNSRYSSVVFR